MGGSWELERAICPGIMERVVAQDKEKRRGSEG